MILVFDEKSNLIGGLQYDLIRCFDNLVVAYFFGPRVYTYYFERYANYRLITLAKVLVHYTRLTSNKYRVVKNCIVTVFLLNEVFPNGNPRNIYITSWVSFASSDLSRYLFNIFSPNEYESFFVKPPILLSSSKSLDLEL